LKAHTDLAASVCRAGPKETTPEHPDRPLARYGSILVIAVNFWYMDLKKKLVYIIYDTQRSFMSILMKAKGGVEFDKVLDKEVCSRVTIFLNIFESQCFPTFI